MLPSRMVATAPPPQTSLLAITSFHSASNLTKCHKCRMIKDAPALNTIIQPVALIGATNLLNLILHLDCTGCCCLPVMARASTSAATLQRLFGRETPRLAPAACTGWQPHHLSHPQFLASGRKLGPLQHWLALRSRQEKHGLLAGPRLMSTSYSTPARILRCSIVTNHRWAQDSIVTNQVI